MKIENEIWKDVVGYEKLYQVSNLGRVKNANDKILKGGYLNKRYLAVGLTKNGLLKTMTIHRLVAIAFIPNPENKLQVNHKDGVKKNNNANNLEWNTHSENTFHAYKNNLMSARKGQSNTCSKLKEFEAKQIR